jgi:LysR family transcriptional regulator, mexEF-oprN operon transcriptional activator
VDARPFKNVNLNLLIVLVVLMRERSVSRTAKHLLVSQPAVSSSLKQLRALFRDELFMRIDGGTAPTSLAHAIHGRLLPSLEIIESILQQKGCLKKSAREFGNRDKCTWNFTSKGPT